jgi:isoleucyl-tRNA synthetase
MEHLYFENQVLGDGNLHVVDTLRRCGALWKHAPFAHRYPVDWRTKKPIIQRACEQWFCRLDGLAEQARRALSAGSLHAGQMKCSWSIACNPIMTTWFYCPCAFIALNKWRFGS